jgi:2-polyprenyl-6-methoxyphenol hydroxylase-like FAD-dependent oxidoreductase
MFSRKTTKHSQPTVAVVGGSLGGLAAANTFVKLGWHVDVFERSKSTFEAKGHGLGFVDVALWQELRGVRMMRHGRQASRDQGAFYYGDLWRYLYDGLPEGTLRLGQSVDNLGDDLGKPTICGKSYDLCIVADGGWSGLRRYVTSTLPEYAGYVCWRGSVDANKVPGFQSFGIFKNGHFDTIVLPLSPDDGRNCIVCGCFIATPEDEITWPEAGASRHSVSEKDKTRDEGMSLPDFFLPLYRRLFGNQDGGELVRLVEAIISEGKFTPHAQFEYGADKVTAGRVILVGDAAHMASPRTAVGAHTAILDAIGLRHAFQDVRGDIDSAVKLYNRDGVQRAQGLLQRSRHFSREFVPAEGVSAIVSPSLLLER